MSFLDDLVSISISATTKTPTRKGFGTPLLLSQVKPATWGVNLVRTFAQASELITAGFLATDPVYLAALALKAQSPSPKRFKVGIRTSPATMTVKLTVTIATTGYVYSFKVDGKTITYTVLAAATTSTVATALAALITGGTVGATAVAAGPDITVTAPAGKVFDVSGHYENGLTLLDETTDPGVVTNLTAINNEDSDWYGLVPDHFGKAEALAAAPWIESEKKLAAFDASDTACMDPVSTTDVIAAAKAAAYARTGFWFSRNAILHFTGAAIMGSRLPATPGSDTWMYKTLATITYSNLQTGERDAILSKKGNVYIQVAGINMTQEGWTSSGEYYDVTRFIDWLGAEMQTRVFGQLVNAPKVPFTNKGIQAIAGTMLGTLKDGVKAGGLSDDVEPVVDAPDVADIDPSFRATRTIPQIPFSGRLAGAIHELSITGVLSV